MLYRNKNKTKQSFEVRSENGRRNNHKNGFVLDKIIFFMYREHKLGFNKLNTSENSHTPYLPFFLIFIQQNDNHTRIKILSLPFNGIKVLRDKNYLLKNV